MLQVARLAPRLLGESADLIAQFALNQLNDDGGFNDRAGASDLYYSVFGLECAMALRRDVPHGRVAEYLRRFGDGEGLDYVHLTCLARCWANLPPELRMSAPREAIAQRIERYRARDGGYAPAANAPAGTVYGCFLALAAYQDLGLDPPDSQTMLRCVEASRSADGGYANQPRMGRGLTTTTAAAVTMLHQLGQSISDDLVRWLLSRCRAEGGFFASPAAPVPDLLSTATALHALSCAKADVRPIAEPCLDFVDTLWTARGGFVGSWADNTLDCEYTYYGLLALGHLSLA